MGEAKILGKVATELVRSLFSLMQCGEENGRMVSSGGGNQGHMSSMEG